MSQRKTPPGVNQGKPAAKPPVRTSTKQTLRGAGVTMTVESGDGNGDGDPAATQLSAAVDQPTQASPAVDVPAAPGEHVPTGVVPASGAQMSPAVGGGPGPAGAPGAPGAPGAAGAPRPVPRPAAPRPSTGARRVRLSISRIDPWSVMKLGFLLSVALGIVLVVATAVAWNVLDGMGVFANMQQVLEDIGASEQFGIILDYLQLRNVMSMSVIIAIVNVALITALSTLAAFIYNVVAALVGGLHMTLTDD